ncbi:MAG TPA: glycerophosphodiester phosphodiesterase family protein, partial [Rhodoglobus sp.]|nr:glycerophosphodiester phosphodiesterase family protein [Rhodoglobus sp.]
RLAVALVAGKLGLVPVMRLALRGLVAVQVPEKAAGLRVTTRAMIDRFHRAGVEVHVWTINDRARMRQLVDRGADGIVTDRIDLAIAEFGDPV